MFNKLNVYIRMSTLETIGEMYKLQKNQLTFDPGSGRNQSRSWATILDLEAKLYMRGGF